MVWNENIELGSKRWDQNEWFQIIKRGNCVPIYKVIECLGLHLASEPGRRVKFENGYCTCLAKAIHKLSKAELQGLPKGSNASLTELQDSLLHLAKDPDSHKNEVESLLTEYGPNIWGRDIDRNHLLKPNPSERYKENLFYEDEKHKQVLHVHLERWIIIKKSNYIRNLPLERKTYENNQLTGSDSGGFKRKIKTNSANSSNDGVNIEGAKRRKLLNVPQALILGSSLGVSTGGFTAVNSSLPTRETPKHQLRTAAWISAQGLQQRIYESDYYHSQATKSQPPSRCVQQLTLQINQPDHHQHIQHQQSAPLPTIPPNASTHHHEHDLGPDLHSRDYPVAQHAQQPRAPQPQSQSPQQQPIQAQQNPHALLPPRLCVKCTQRSNRPCSLRNVSVHGYQGCRQFYHCSTFDTPLAHAATDEPITALNTQSLSALLVQSAAAYGSQQTPIHEVPQPTPAVSQQSAPTSDLDLLQYEATAHLFKIFFSQPLMFLDEAALLQRLRTLWPHCESLFRVKLASHYDLVSKILYAWLNEQEAIVTLRQSMAANPSVSKAGLVDRILVMNDLRAMHFNWKTMSTVDSMSPEDLLCMAFEVMTMTEGSGYLFKDRLAQLNSSMFDFLQRDDKKIVLQRSDVRAVRLNS